MMEKDPAEPGVYARPTHTTGPTGPHANAAARSRTPQRHSLSLQILARLAQTPYTG